MSILSSVQWTAHRHDTVRRVVIKGIDLVERRLEQWQDWNNGTSYMKQKTNRNKYSFCLSACKSWISLKYVEAIEFVHIYICNFMCFSHHENGTWSHSQAKLLRHITLRPIMRCNGFRSVALLSGIFKSLKKTPYSLPYNRSPFSCQWKLHWALTASHNHNNILCHLTLAVRTQIQLVNLFNPVPIFLLPATILYYNTRN